MLAVSHDFVEWLASEFGTAAVLAFADRFDADEIGRLAAFQSVRERLEATRLSAEHCDAVKVFAVVYGELATLEKKLRGPEEDEGDDS